MVDDSATMRDFFRGVLSDEFDCEMAIDGSMALGMALKSPPDAVVTDLEMPNKDGVELLRALRQEEATKNVPVVVVTTVTALDKVNECRALGCVGFVLKPVQKEYLVAKIRQLTRG